MASLRSRVVPNLFLGVVGIIIFAKGVVAHGGHNMDKIKEGEVISQDPLVRRFKDQSNVKDKFTDEGNRTRYYGYIS